MGFCGVGMTGKGRLGRGDPSCVGMTGQLCAGRDVSFKTKAVIPTKKMGSPRTIFKEESPRKGRIWFSPLEGDSSCVGMTG